MRLKDSCFDIGRGYEVLHDSYPGYTKQPVIGITGNYREGDCCVADGYYAAVLKAGGTPLVIPPYDEEEALLNTLDHVDGLLLSGGGDINPLFLGEEPIRELHAINPRRDRQELLLVRLAADRQIPLLGICRGHQMLTAALGGKLYQDLYAQAGGEPIKHSQELERGYPSHTVTVAADSLLHRIFGQDTLAVNSFHHQAVREAAPGFRVCAKAADGIIEAVESTEYKSMIGVQWHPECMAGRGDESMMPLFRWLTGEATSFARAKSLHDRMLTLDSHCDTPMFFGQEIDFHRRDPKILVDLHKMREGRLDATVMVAYLKQQERSEKALAAAVAEAGRILDQIEAMVASCKPYAEIARTPAALYRLKRQGKKAVMQGIENGYAIGRDLSNVERFRRRGVVYMTLCHNGDNDLCDSARGNGEHHGVSDFGREVIREMNRTGMMADLSHASEKSFFDALELSTVPIVCSHSSCRALCDHPRNLTDDQLRALARRGGVMQLCLYGGFLRKEGTATIHDAVAHLCHAVEVAGIDHVGIGTDFDGDGGICGCASASELINLTRRLTAEGFTDEEMQKIWGGNFLRVMTQVQEKGEIQ